MRNYFNKLLAKQLKRPSGLLGKLVARKMQERNLSTYDWMISKMDFNSSSNVLEIGYGTGKVLNFLATNNTHLNLYGVDFSKVMFRKANKNNAEFVKEGRMNLTYGDILQYKPSINFDLIFGINVIYFWNDLKIYMEKIHSLLSPKGKVYLYMTDIETLKNFPATNTNIFNKRLVEDVLVIMKGCGFNEGYCDSGSMDSRKGHCLIGVK